MKKATKKIITASSQSRDSTLLLTDETVGYLELMIDMAACGYFQRLRVHDWGSRGRRFKSCRPETNCFKGTGVLAQAGASGTS